MSEPLAPVDLVLLWHHHQPDYRRPADGTALLPWTRLHASKDYVDMARHVERHPGLKVTFNLVPVLIDQVEAAARGGPDELFDRLARPIASLSVEEREAVAARCVQVPPHALDRWPSLRTLRERVAAWKPAAEPCVQCSNAGGRHDRLVALHEQLPFVCHARRFLIEARKP